VTASVTSLAPKMSADLLNSTDAYHRHRARTEFHEEGGAPGPSRRPEGGACEPRHRHSGKQLCRLGSYRLDLRPHRAVQAHRVPAVLTDEGVLGSVARCFTSLASDRCAARDNDHPGSGDLSAGLELGRHCSAWKSAMRSPA
jgi:hypothetical protein